MNSHPCLPGVPLDPPVSPPDFTDDPRQRRTTVRAKMPQRFRDETLWPEFRALDAERVAQRDGLADEVIRRSIHKDFSDAAEVAGRLVEPGAEDRAQTCEGGRDRTLDDGVGAWRRSDDGGTAERIADR